MSKKLEIPFLSFHIQIFWGEHAPRPPSLGAGVALTAPPFVTAAYLRLGRRLLQILLRTLLHGTKSNQIQLLPLTEDQERLRKHSLQRIYQKHSRKIPPYRAEDN